MAKKQSIVDVLCRDTDGCQYIIEMQIASAKGFEARAQYYASKLDKKTGENNLDKLSFTFVDLVKFDENRTKAVNELTLEEKFYFFLRYAPEMNDGALSELIGNDGIIKKAFHELERFGWSEEEIKRYEAEDKRVRDNRAVLLQAIDEEIKKGKEQGKKEGLKEGKVESKVEVAKQMLVKGMDSQTIQELTGLSPQLIERIRREL